MPRAGLTPERLATEGAELADEVGFEAVTVSALARRVGVQVASIYSHLSSSEDLRTRIALLALGEIAERADRALAGRAGRAALEALGGAYRDYARRHPGRFAATNHPLARSPENDQMGLRHADLARAALRDYGLTGAEETHAVRLLGSTIRGFVDLEARGGFARSRPSGEASWQRTLDVLDIALRQWPSGD